MKLKIIQNQKAISHKKVAKLMKKLGGCRHWTSKTPNQVIKHEWKLQLLRLSDTLLKHLIRGHFSSSVLLFFQPTWQFFKSSQICRLPAPLRHPGMQWANDVSSLMISFRAGSLPMGIRQISSFISLLSSSPKNSTDIITEGVGESQRTAIASLFLANLQRKLKRKSALVLKFPLIMFIWEQAASCKHWVTEK